MLAEATKPALQEHAFDMTYGWQFKDLFNDIAQGKKTVADLDAYLNGEEKQYNPNSYRMLHITNHDLNSWEGTEFQRLGDATETFLVLSTVIKGMPLIYSGQEAGNTKALAFFEHDPIQWKDHKFRGLYTRLFQLKKTNKALWNWCGCAPRTTRPCSPSRAARTAMKWSGFSICRTSRRR